MGLIKGVTFLIAVTVLGSGSQIPKSLSPEEIQKRQVGEIDLSGVTTINALTRALVAAHVPGGIVTETGCGADESYTLVPSGPTLRDVLDSIVAVNPQYQWSIDRGVVNLIPSNKGPVLLDLRIAELNVKSAKTVDEILVRLFALPVMREEITRLNLSQVSGEIGMRSLGRPGSNQEEESAGLMLYEKNVTLREALNAIAREQGSAVWSYREQHCGGRNEFSIGFTVR